MRRVIVFLLGYFICTFPAQAALELELTQGVDAALPIAVVPFKTNVDNDQSASTDISQVISADLQYSGRFNVLDKAEQKSFSSEEAAQDFKYWKSKRVDNFLLGSVERLSNGQYRVTYRLLDVYKGLQKPKQANETADEAILAQQEFTISGKEMRRLAHHISDLVYQQLTGERGIFSTRIAYVAVDRESASGPQYKLIVADADGFNPQAILISKEPIMSPAWSPEGKRIAYVSFENRRATIYVANVETGKRQVISQYPGINGAPAWSPDGKSLALVLSKTGNPKVYTLNLASGELKQITDGWSIDTEPNWAPNGKEILFTSDRGGAPQIYRYILATGKVERVSFSGNYNARASFFPAGDSIVMIHRSEDMFNIAKEDLTSGTVDVLTNTGVDESPSISPNGKMVLYATHFGGKAVLGLVSTDGRVRLRIPAEEGDVQEPAWSPFVG